jgi:hypothetical protein
MLLSNFILALLATITIELAVATGMGFRSKEHVKTIIIVNVLTNPALNYFIVAMSSLGMPVSTGMILVLELFVVLVEWRLLMFALKKEWKTMLLLSLAMNATSYTVGVLLMANFGELAYPPVTCIWRIRPVELGSPLFRQLIRRLDSSGRAAAWASLGS